MGGGRSIVRSFNRTERQRNRNRAATDRISHSNIQLLFDHSFEVAFEYSFEYPFDESFVYSSDCLLESSFDYPLAYVCAIENSLDCSVTYSSIDSFMFFITHSINLAFRFEQPARIGGLSEASTNWSTRPRPCRASLCEAGIAWLRRDK